MTADNKATSDLLRLRYSLGRRVWAGLQIVPPLPRRDLRGVIVVESVFDNHRSKTPCGPPCARGTSFRLLLDLFIAPGLPIIEAMLH
jgi:hypothetical protein